MRAAIFVALLSLAVASQTTPQPLTVTVDARSIHQGELVVYTVHTAQPTDDLKARAFGHLVATYRIDGVTWKVLAGIDLETAPGSYPVIINATMASGRVETTQTLLVRTKAFPTRTLAVDDAFVNPPASETERIAAEGARLTKLWATTTPEKLWEGAFVRPVSEAANSAFGSRSVFNGQARSPHTGADFLSPAGTPVHAPAGGKVVIAAPLYYSGNTVVIDHGLGIYSLFAHFSAIAVKEGDIVTAGQVVGKVGATGRVTGPHLHWAMRVNNARIDPLSLLAELGGPGKQASNF